MILRINLQNISETEHCPSEEQIQTWITAALDDRDELTVENPEVTVRIVDEQEGAALNQKWRQKEGPTNILSFAYSEDKFSGDLLGDLIICAPVVEQEAKELGKSLESHWAHMFVHGSLHLLGFDHIDETEAGEMEALETGIMQNLGYANPYHW